ncbi:MULTISPECIES: N-acetylglucosamine-6-phosphate deacetylase [Rhodomicrobium]|uniref:N-acetylglucosamine-6-phosphate deacetylase n=1 Tax=Rhodomicrobium TaxID=1068 RepID=UPI000B4A9FC6|nr:MULTISPECIES: N-acetylglucosamine-6-phosphate deacetylase [Rhodomicrobium]
MTRTIALTGARIFDGRSTRGGAAVLTADGIITGIVPEAEVPADAGSVRLDGGWLAPGFIDLQANGGGGVLFNEEPTVDGIRKICAAHARFGTTALLATLITDTPEITQRGIAAGVEAYRQGVPGFLGLHLEGPHLSIAKHGAHRPDLIRPMTGRDVETLRQARAALPNLMVTLAPEAVEDAQIAELADAGICVSLGHSNAPAERAKTAFAAGARAVTHLFNAMSGLTHREPGLVGAALNASDVYAGLIADGHHVVPDAIAIALRAKIGRGRIFLVTDSMSTTGTDQTEFELNGRRILRRDGVLTLEDGTLAGADLDMNSAVRFMAGNLGLPFEEALRMASLYPAQCLGIAATRGCLLPGVAADLVHLNEACNVQAVWIAGSEQAGRR